MRAVSLSDERVQELLKDKFVCATVNLQGNPQAGFSFNHKPGDPARPVPGGLGERNNQMLFLTPQGEIINARAGYVGPKELLAEIELSLAIREALPKIPEAKAQKEAVVKAHKDYLNKPSPNGRPRVRVNVPGAKQVIVGGAGRSLLDHEFVMQNPLLPIRDFTIDKMLGHAPRTRFFFGQEVIPAKPANPGK